MDFKPYYNDWLDITSLFSQTKIKDYNDIKVNLNLDFFKNLNFDDNTLKKYRVDAVLKASNVLGSKPALCFSGGVDSQCMLQCWLESGLKFDVYTLVFKNDFNKMDYDLARKVCNEYNVNVKEIEIDVLKFLNYFNHDYALKYKSVSPHFNVHYKLFDILREYGHSGVCSGGDAPYKNLKDNIWGNNFSKNPNTFYQYAKINNYPTIGNFLGYTAELAWAISISTKPTYYYNKPQDWNNFLTTWDAHVDGSMLNNFEQKRYYSKCNGYKKVGFKITEQEKKFTGFESVKEFLKNETGNGWEFEHRYRHPLEKQFEFFGTPSKFVFEPFVENFLNNMYQDKHAAL